MQSTGTRAEKSSTIPTANPDFDSSVESFEKDLAAAIVPDYAQDIDAAAERRVLRRIDLFLIPWMWIGYGFVYYDKVAKIPHRLSAEDITDPCKRPFWAVLYCLA